MLLVDWAKGIQDAEYEVCRHAEEADTRMSWRLSAH